MHDYLLETGDVAEGYGPAEEGEGGGAFRGPQAAVLVVRGGVVPAAEALTDGARERAGRVVGVEEGEEVGG